MKTFILTTLSTLTALAIQAAVVTYPAPPGETLSADYEILAAGQRVDVYTARVLDPPFAGKEYDYGGPYSFANFDVSGPVEVRITSKRSLRDTVVLPPDPAINMRFEGDNALVLTLPGPKKLSLEPAGKKGSLLLFANPLEEDPPTAASPGVIYFGPGIHAKVVRVKSGDLTSDGFDYRKQPPLTGPDVLVAEVKGTPFPKLLDPVDDLPPATVITHVLPRKGGMLLVRGTTSDNGSVVKVVVNGQAAMATRPNFAEWEAMVPAQGDVSAHAEDAAGNIERTPHQVAAGRMTQPTGR